MLDFEDFVIGFQIARFRSSSGVATAPSKNCEHVSGLTVSFRLLHFRVLLFCYNSIIYFFARTDKLSVSICPKVFSRPSPVVYELNSIQHQAPKQCSVCSKSVLGAYLGGGAANRNSPES